METSDKLTKEGAKSLFTIGITLILLIAGWSVIVKLIYPTLPIEQQAAQYVEKNRPLLIQVAENAMDETVWEGIQTAGEVRNVLGEGQIAGVYSEEDRVVFERSDGEAEGLRRVVYIPTGEYAFVSPNTETWTCLTEEDGKSCWRSENNEKHTATVYKLDDNFWFEDVLMTNH